MNTTTNTTKRAYYSQSGEDILLWQLFETQQKPGIFVEVGALDGIRFSNTYSFEQAGWTGICVEAHPDYIELVRKNRPNSLVVFAAAGDEDKTVTFYTNKRGSLSSLDSSLKEYFETYGEFFTGFEPVEVPMKRLDTILAEANIQTPLDILSIDVEGAELLVLQGLDIERYRPRVVVLEVMDDERLKQYNKYMTSFGYHNARKIGPNSFYARAERDINILKNAPLVGELVVYPHPMDEDQSIQRRQIPEKKSVAQPSVASSVKKLLRRVKARLFPAPQKPATTAPQPATSGKMAVRDRYADIRQRITAQQPIIIDGGASTGNSSRRFLQDYPNAQIHAFEPIPSALEHLKAALVGHSNLHIHPQALGASNQRMTFHVLNRPSSSSFLVPTALNVHYHPQEMDVAQDIEVEMVRLDSAFHERVDLLKLDLQGYELEALKGAGEWLKQVRIITTEVEFVPLYKGQPLFSEIELYLREQGFYLFNLYELWTHTDGQLTAGDAVFFNQRDFDSQGRASWSSRK